MRIRKKYLNLLLITLIVLLAGTYIFTSRKNVKLSSPVSEKKIASEQSKKPRITDIQPYLFRNNVSDESEEASKAAYREKVRSAATNSTQLTVDKCMLDPLILTMASSSALTVNNGDQEKHTIWLSDQKYEIRANGTTKIKLEFKKGTGIYVISCDNFPEAGIFYIVP